MTTAQRHTDVLVVGGDAVGLLFAVLTAQRFMQVTVVGSAPAEASPVRLDPAAFDLLERSGIEVATGADGLADHGQLVSALEGAARAAGVHLALMGEVTSFEAKLDGVAANLRCEGVSETIATRWLVGAHERVRSMLDVDTDRHGETVVARQVRAGQVFLIGDGLMTQPPLTDDISLGCADAANLAWRLQAVHQGHAYDRLLDAYDAERRPLSTAFAIDGWSDSPICVGQVAGADSMVGNTLPAVAVGDAPLDNRLNHGWSIIVDSVDELPHDLLARWIGIGARIVMLGDQLQAIPSAPRRGAIIVRPDRIVAAVAHDADSLCVLSEQLLGWYADGEPTAD